MVFSPRRHSTLPGKNINLIFSIAYLSLLVLFPLGFLILSIQHVTFEDAYAILFSRRTLQALRVSFTTSIAAALIDLFIGIIIAWVLVKYRFFGKRFFDSIVDLPFAMPTAVSGIALATIYSDKGWIGSLLEAVNIKVSYTPVGILIALVFVGLPFVVRSIQPAVEALDLEMEEAAASLGASRIAIVRRVIFPQLLPSIITGFTMSLARGLGEYGSVIFIAGNIPFVSEILPLLIVIELEEFNYDAASVLAVAMLSLSFILLVTLGFLGSVIRRRYR
ncbi:sulfate ABC transporter permease subunit CysT [Estrella lausannensis]|uniref:Sulfate transport system permease protein CysT n=1 Tax=Estrella lausannensis TaxID=483423 RepID=A0A0H5DSG8_9BACT|nr:sulfate ABC transporter permease subunit CysT [Estrella lausannensis]CRX38719.1 sulfate ABC transporter, inner membrane subunit CysT [Estrella lausannensis]